MFATKAEVLTIMPVTSPRPIVVAFSPIFKFVKVEPFHISRLPLVADGFALCKLSTSFTVKSLFDVKPPAPFMVKLLTAAENMDAGRLIAEEFVNIKLADALLASILPLVRTGEFPDIVRVLDPTVRVPAVNVNVPPMLRSPYKLIPVALFIVKLLSTKAGILMFAPVPPIIILVELPPVTVPVMAVTTPLNVKVFGPIAKFPAISAIPLFIVKSPFNVNPLALFIVNESIWLLTKDPKGIF